jgi:hypothetical protein
METKETIERGGQCKLHKDQKKFNPLNEKSIQTYFTLAMKAGSTEVEIIAAVWWELK